MTPLPRPTTPSPADLPMQGLSVGRDASYSRYVQRIRRRYADQLAWLPTGAPDRARMVLTFERLCAAGHHSGAALRILRQLVLERLVVLDSQASEPLALAVVTGAMTELAELALDVAMRQSAQDLDALYGPPQVGDGKQQPTRRACMWVIGMGKLGARELNVSSDIDLIYVYDEQGQTQGRADGRGVISNQEYFAQQVKAVHALIGEVTEHGFVFRVDLALRPNGNSGPPAVSLGALEEYFQVQGREWERFAWLKGRVISTPTWASQAQFEAQSRALDDVVRPFVYRKYFDFNAIAALRQLHSLIRAETGRKSARRAGGHERMWIVNNYNTMVSIAQTRLRIGR
jgi:glutamate-ammonia-ligase adenylyltransferase